MTDLKIRKVIFDEADILLQLSRQTFFDAFAEINDAGNMQTYAAINFTRQKTGAELAEPNSAFYFAVYNNEIAGYLKLNTSDAQTEFKADDALEIERIYILQKYQGRQFGQQLLNYALDTAKQNNHQYIWLGVWENNYSAIRFYERHGFIKFGSHYFMLGNDRQTDILMKQELA